MPEQQYGLISNVDADCIERTLERVLNEFDDYIIRTCEVGIYSGVTSNGISKFIHKRNRGGWHIGIDNGKDKEHIIYFPLHGEIIYGDSNEVYNKLPNESQHFIFIDACHCFSHVVSDFFCYAPKVKTGGYIAFHDTGVHIKPYKDFQHGNVSDPDSYISVRKALMAVGLLEKKYDGWELVFDMADDKNEAGGVCIFKKLS